MKVTKCEWKFSEKAIFFYELICVLLFKSKTVYGRINSGQDDKYDIDKFSDELKLVQVNGWGTYWQM